MSIPLFLRRLLIPATLCLTSSGLHAQVKMESTLLAAGGANAANATMRLAGSFGQPIIGTVTTSSEHLMQGFWFAGKPSLSSAEPVAGESALTLDCAPNPITDQATVEIVLPESGTAMLALYDVAGKRVLTLMNEAVGKGPQTLHFDSRQLPDGGYRLVLLTGEKQTTLPIRIVR